MTGAAHAAMELLNQLEGRSAACAHAAVPRRCNPANHLEIVIASRDGSQTTFG